MTAVGESTPQVRPSKLGRYELITRIGEGGMAEVQLAIQRGPAGFEKLVVIKLVHEKLASQKNFVDMLLDEARVAALVKHPNVIDIYDLGQVDGRYFIAMEYLEGEPLLAVLRAGREGKPLDALSMTRLIAETAEGLDAAHELRSMSGESLELVHHDVSLGNIVVLYNGAVKLVDFGVAKATMTTAGTTRVQGKFSYMAPEKLQGGAGDRRSDIWSLGVVLWEALTLRRLFKGGNDDDTLRMVLTQSVPPPSSVNPKVPIELDAIVARAVARDPNDRYQQASQLAIDLEDVLRKHHYGRRNDVIAKYMQATFEGHIAARKKLLQEVSSKGRASAAVLEAVFREPSVDLKTSGEFSVQFARGSTSTEAPGAPPELASERLATGTPSKAYTPPVADPGDGATVVEPPPIALDSAPAARANSNFDSMRRSATEMSEASLSRSHLIFGGTVIFVALLIFVVALAARSANEADPESSLLVDAAVTRPLAPQELAPQESAKPPPSPSPTPSPPTTAPAPPTTTPAPPTSAPPTTTPAPPAPATPKNNPAPRPRPPVVAPRPAPPKVDVVELHREGFQALVIGDHKTALTTLKRAQLASPNYAPTYRTLGILYEKLGQKPQAKAAFARYLALAPGASDAEAIRTRMNSL